MKILNYQQWIWIDEGANVTLISDLLYKSRYLYAYVFFYIVAFSIHLYMYKDAKKRKYDTFSAIRSYQDTYLNEGCVERLERNMQPISIT